MEKGKDFCDVTLVCEDDQIYVHKLIFSFHCEKCPAKFTLESDLKKHKWTHSETTTSSCNLCQKYFSHIPEWKEHMKKQSYKFSQKYFHLHVLKVQLSNGVSFLPKHEQNFVFQVF